MERERAELKLLPTHLALEDDTKRLKYGLYVSMSAHG